MSPNDILRRLRYIFDLNDKKMIQVFQHGGKKTNKGELTAWLKKEQDPDLVPLYDDELAAFLNGLIIEKRGRRDGPQPKPEKSLSNNIVLRKLKIALDFKSDDVLDVLDLADLKVSKYELSAFFRKPTHKHYRKCKDQILRNFLLGLQLKYRPKDIGSAETKD